MADEFKIPVAVEITTSGGDAAKKALDDLAVKPKTVTAGGGKSEADDLKEELDLMKQKGDAAHRYALELDAIADQQKLAAAQGTDRANKVFLTGSLGAIAAAAAVLLEEFKLIGEAIQSINTLDLKKFDAGMADSIKNTQEWLNISSPFEAIRKQFTGETFKEEVSRMNDQIHLTAESLDAGVKRFLASGQRTAEEIKRFSQDLKDARVIMDARDEADLAERRRQEGAAIRTGAAPEDEKAKTAAMEAEKRIAAINRAESDRGAEVQAAWDDLQKQKLRDKQLRDKSTTPEQWAAAKPELEANQQKIRDATAEFENQQREYQAMRALNDERRRGIRADAAGTIEGLQGDKTERQQKEQDDLRKQREAQAEKDRREAERADKETQQRELERRQEELDASSRGASGRILGGARGRANKTASAVGEALENGTNEDEIAKLTRMVNENSGKLGASMLAALRDVLGGLAKQAGEIDVLRRQIKNK